MRQMVRVREFGDDLSQPLEDFITDLKAVIDAEGGKGKLTFNTERISGCYGDPDTYSVYIERPETDKEMLARQEREAKRRDEYKAGIEAIERAKYEALKKKFEAPQ